MSCQYSSLFKHIDVTLNERNQLQSTYSMILGTCNSKMDKIDLWCYRSEWHFTREGYEVETEQKAAFWSAGMFHISIWEVITWMNGCVKIRHIYLYTLLYISYTSINKLKRHYLEVSCKLFHIFPNIFSFSCYNYIQDKRCVFFFSPSTICTPPHHSS